MTTRRQIRDRVEWPTLALLGVFYICFAGLTWFWHDLHWAIALPAAGYLTCLYGGLQHEAIHGHPTRSRALNEILVFPGFLLWVPYGRYRDQHLHHHGDERLTDPYGDPESFYLTPEDWGRMAWPARVMLKANNTLSGRLLLGPAISMIRFWRAETRLLLRGDKAALVAWAGHVPAVALALAWIWGVCAINPLVFFIAFVYPGSALILLRSYAEHRAHKNVGARTAVVETCPAMALLFLNNNLHAVHHARPGAPWYRLPGIYRAERHGILDGNEGYLIGGYRQLFARYLLRPKEPVPHPLERGKPL